MYDLVVISPVAGLQAGERITDPDLVAEILADERHVHVVKVPRDPSAAPAADAPTIADDQARTAPADSTVARVPFMITQAMRERLRALGKTDDEIRQMTPAEANAILGA